MNKDRIVELIEGIKRWKIYKPPTLPTMGIRTRIIPWNDILHYFHDCDGNERIIAWTDPDYVQQFSGRLRGIASNSKASSPVALSKFIMNEGDDNE